MRYKSLLLIGLLILGMTVGVGVADDGPGSRYVDSYPTAASKKGLQVEDVADALALGIKHAAINVNLCQLVDVSADDKSDQPFWDGEGRRFYFKGSHLAQLDRTIKALSDHGVVVNLILLTYHSADERINEVMLHPKYDRTAPNRLGMFNTATPDGRAWLKAVMEFTAERWSRPDEEFGRVAGYIVGNEVNSHWWWANMGRVRMEEFADAYLAALRLMHGAVRRQSSWARVYVPLDHHWGIRYAAGDERQTFGGKAFVDYFARRAREGGDFDWHVAYHPYPENLFEPRFWNDTTALPSDDTPRITFKNLDVLTRYLQRDELLYHGAPRRVILSEQGFHTPDRPEGEAIQAAAYAAASKRVEQLDGIDAFILHRHVDHPHEGGLRLGLRSLEPGDGEPRRKKLIYECFRAADTPEWEAAFEFALPIVGKEVWE
jgi:hypothetical protein